MTALPPHRFVRPTGHYVAGGSLQDEEYESPSPTPSYTSEHAADISESEGGDVEEGGQDRHGIEEEKSGDEPIRLLQAALQSNYKDSVFACGGSVPIVPNTEDEKVWMGRGGVDLWNRPKGKTTAAASKTTTKAVAAVNPRRASLSSSVDTVPSTEPHPPVDLRWDPRNGSALAKDCKVTLPLHLSDNTSLGRLVADMHPATFGLGGKDVYDESYRKALKLDPSAFSTSFCPYQVGIIDVISQLLLPNPSSHKQRAVKAELYKLNVYTGPSGHFRAHVDTPRSESQFGSLVVCLPAKHEGGTLEVQHGGQTMSFDWASAIATNTDQIQWAAFYSDCKHEVLPVRSGHRITLTYNLYATRGNNQLSNHASALDVTQLPLYSSVESVINDASFLPKGGYLGFYTAHAYPHHNMKGILTDALKGVDMTLWNAFKSLGCAVFLRPIISDEEMLNWDLSETSASWIGQSFTPVYTDTYVERMYDWDTLLADEWGLEALKAEDVVWLNDHSRSNKEIALTYLAYGNQASINMSYSTCAMIVSVPMFKDGQGRAASTVFNDMED